MSNITLVFYAYTSVASLSTCLLPSLKLVQLLYKFISFSFINLLKWLVAGESFISVHSISGIVMCVCMFSSAVSFAWDKSGLFMYHLQPQLAWAISLFFWFDFCSFWNFCVLNQTARALLKQKLWVGIFPPFEETGTEQLPSFFLQCCRGATKCYNWQKDVTGRSK